MSKRRALKGFDRPPGRVSNWKRFNFQPLILLEAGWFFFELGCLRMFKYLHLGSQRLLLVMMIIMGATGPLAAIPWELSPGLVDNGESLGQIAKKFPDLRKAADLENLLSELNRMGPLQDLSATLSQGKIMIHGRSARLIGEINVNLTTHAYQKEVESRVYKFVGQVDSKEVKKKIISAVKIYLQERGMYLSQIDLISTASSNRTTTYQLNITESLPCRIRKISTSFKIPDSISIKLKVGNICDRRMIDDVIIELKKELVTAGYRRSSLLNPELKWDKKTNTAEVRILGNLGKKISYRIEGSSNDSLNEIDEMTSDPDSMINELRNNYRINGYDDVQISRPSVQSNNDEIKYIFSVDSGPKYEVVDIQFQGHTVFSRDEMIEIIELDSSFYLNNYLNREHLKKGIENLRNHYNRNGFWDAKIRFPRITKNRRLGQAKLIYSISEGRQRVFEKLIIRGNTVISSEEIERLLPVENGDSLEWQMLLDFEKSIKLYYRNIGYIHAAVDLNLIPSRRTRNIYIKIIANINEKVRVRVGKIKISGLAQTRRKVVERELRFKTGDWYQPEKIELTRKALVNLGIFSLINIIPDDSDSLSAVKGKIDFNIVVREGRPGSVSFGPGWSRSEGGRYEIESTYLNIGGVGRKVFGRVSFTEEKDQTAINGKSLLGRRLSVSYLEPYLLTLPISGTMTIAHKASGESERWDLSRSGTVSLSHQFRNLLFDQSIRIYYRQKFTDEITDEKLISGSKNLIIASGSVRSGRIGMEFRRDNRDDTTWPTSGSFLHTSIDKAEYGFGGDLSFLKWELGSNYYAELLEDFVLAGGFFLSSFNQVKRLGNIVDVLPASERFNSGGADDNRGFEKRSLGPKTRIYSDNGGDIEEKVVSIGGTQKSVFKIEFRYHFADNYGMTLFADASTTFFLKEEMQAISGNSDNNAEILDNFPFKFTELITDPSIIWRKHYLSSGLALNFLSPLGSFNFSYGFPLKKCPDTRRKCEFPSGKVNKNFLLTGVFHINISTDF